MTMAQTIEYDDTNLQRLYSELDPKRRRQALRAGFRKEAQKVRKVAVSNLRSSGIRTDRDLEKGIRALVFKQQLGFRVTIGTSNGAKKAGYHKNRQGLEKPVLLWAEGGTKQRRTKGNGGRRFQRKRGSHPTGAMPAYGFMSKTKSQTETGITEDLKTMVTEQVIRIARKYGSK